MINRADALLTALAAACLSIAAYRWDREAPVERGLPITRQAAPDELPAGTPDDALHLAAEVAQRNPFRLSNRPARVRHGEEPVAAQAGRPAYRPPLALRAIVGGPPWTALLAGVPGQAGTVMISRGDRIDSLQVREITRDSVVLRGPDTTWVLTVNRGRPE